MRSLFVAFAIVFVGCTQQKVSSESKSTADADRAAIDSGNSMFLGAMRSSDCNALMTTLASDVEFDPPNTPAANGVAAVRKWCEPIFTQVKSKSVTTDGRNVVVAGDWGIESGNYDWTVVPAAGGADQTDKGRFVAIWHRQSDGSWKITRDIWNSAMPLPASQPR